MQWPPDYKAEYRRRFELLNNMRLNPALVAGAKKFYANPKNAAQFIQDWCITYDPRNAASGRPTKMPFIPFPRQRELVDFLIGCLTLETNGLIEKCRDMGATWVCAAVSVYLWLFWDGAAVGWGSRKEQYVDKLGDPDSIFEKIRMIIRMLPPEFLPEGFDPNRDMPYMRIVNPKTNATITGEAGDNIGRGGRKLIYFKDESAHYDRPELIEAALGDNTRVQIDISSVNGLGNVFHRRRLAGVDYDPLIGIVPDETNVFVMDWRDHPAKDAAWYARRKQKSEDEGLMPQFYQEIDRNYAASVEGLLIKPEWAASIIDAHIKLGIEHTGQRIAGLDVADGGTDTNALASRKGIVFDYLDGWGARDTGVTARRAIDWAAEQPEQVEIQYDCIGIGSGVKAEANRLEDEKEMSSNVVLTAWSAAAAVLNPEGRLLQDELGTDDPNSPLIKDFFDNLKAQAWWEFARACERTYKAINDGLSFPAEKLVSISSQHISVEMRAKLQQQLCQVTVTKSARLQKVVVNKTPEGTKSPNEADATVMAYWPLPRAFDLKDWEKAFS